MIDEHFYKVRPAFTLGDLSHRLGVSLPIEAVADEPIQIPAALNVSPPESVTFFSDKRRKDQLETAKATACLTTEKLLPLVTKAGMIGFVVSDPRAAFARLTSEMVIPKTSDLAESVIDETAVIHPTAIIGKAVKIGAGSYIGANSVIDDGVIIGKHCNIAPLVRLSYTVMGDHCIVKSGTVVGGTGFGMAEDDKGVFSIPHIGRVVIHNAVHIGSNTCIDRGQLGDTVLSDDVKVDNLVQIGHNVLIGKGTMIAGHAGISGSCVIGEKCLFGGRASLADHINVGDGAIIAASAGVMTDVPAGEMYSGIPAMPIREHMRTVATIKKLSKRK